MEQNKKSSDEDDIFGQYVASELRSIDNLQTKRYTKWQIQSLLFNAHCGLPAASGPSWMRSPFPSHPMLDTSLNQFPQGSVMAQHSSTPSPFSPSS